MATDVTTPNQPANNESITTLVTGILHDAEQLFKQQVALLKHEVREDLRKTAAASLTLAVGAGLAVLGGLLFVVGFPLLLHWGLPGVPLWAWFLIVGAVLGIVGLGLIFAGKKKFDSFNPLPNETAEALKENVQWIMKPK
jgi:MFS family permease